jgi:hypothetical protein
VPNPDGGTTFTFTLPLAQRKQVSGSKRDPMSEKIEGASSLPR